MNIREWKTFNYELTCEEYDALETTVKVLKKLNNTINSDIVYIAGKKISLTDTIRYLNTLIDNDGKEIYKIP